MISFGGEEYLEYGKSRVDRSSQKTCAAEVPGPQENHSTTSKTKIEGDLLNKKSTKRSKRSTDSTTENKESLLPPLPKREEEFTRCEITNEQLGDPLFRNELEVQMESAMGKIEIVEGFIIRWMPESQRKAHSSFVFSDYGRWARQQGGIFTVGNIGFTLGNNTRAPDASYQQAGNIPPPNITSHMLAQTPPPNWILETEFEHSMVGAETKIKEHWLANGVQEAWLLVLPNPGDNVNPPPVVAPPNPRPVVQMTLAQPVVPYIAIYLSAIHPPLLPTLLGYFPINWHTEFHPPPQSILSGGPPIACDDFMRLLC
mmetsp:Transcript_54364/g.69882  ORF Transcript_54364/g.69882 Transcript_54364/m.69882 type:complete len:314 (-) Transcript_54364:243-1184(-)